MSDQTQQPPSIPGPLMVPYSNLQRDASWIMRHERILIVALVLIAGSWGLQHFLNNAAAADKTKAVVAEQALLAAKATSAQQAAATAQIQAQYAIMVEQLTKQNQTLATAVGARQTALGTQQQANASLPLGSLANRLVALAQPPAGSVSNTETSVTLTQSGTLAVVNTLEQVPVLTANFNDEKKIADNLASELVSANALVTAQVTQVAGLNTQLADQVKADKAELASVKASARKSKLNWFKAGLVVGFVGGIFVGHGGL